MSKVLLSGRTGVQHRPVLGDDRVVGRFNSIWRLEAPDTWRIVFDKGESICADSAK